MNQATWYPEKQHQAITVLEQAEAWMRTWTCAPLNRSGRAYVAQVTRAVQEVPYAYMASGADSQALDGAVLHLDHLMADARQPPPDCLASAADSNQQVGWILLGLIALCEVALIFAISQH